METIKEAGLECANDFWHDCMEQHHGYKDEIEYLVGDVGFSSGVVWAERWIPIEEEMPEPEEIILIEYSYRGRENISTAVRKEDNEKGDCYVTTDGGIMIYPDEITHWRPIEHK